MADTTFEISINGSSCRNSMFNKPIAIWICIFIWPSPKNYIINTNKITHFKTSMLITLSFLRPPASNIAPAAFSIDSRTGSIANLA